VTLSDEHVDATFRVSVLICTRNRPEELDRALRSIETSTLAPHEVVVSDDSTDDATVRMLAASFPSVIWTLGPRIGLGANRNQALSKATGSHVLFIDDDVELAPDFVELMSERWHALVANRRATTILAGAEIQSGRLITPNEQGFLGYQSRPYRAAEPLRTVVINAAVFPRSLFTAAGIAFDPQLVYGYDEVDVTTQAVAAGYRIERCFDAANHHFPSAGNREYYRPFVEASRIYVTAKRRAITERRRLAAVLFVAVAGPHSFAAALRRGGPAGIKLAWNTLRQATTYYRRHVANG
jgi:glycosyltransferase involved in cell wall biosynthesis